MFWTLQRRDRWIYWTKDVEPAGRTKRGRPQRSCLDVDMQRIGVTDEDAGII